MTEEKFSFEFVREDIVTKEVMNLDGSKAILNGDISINILKSTIDIHLTCITKVINLSEGYFPYSFKFTEVTPLVNHLDKETYRPITVLPVVSKIS